MADRTILPLLSRGSLLQERERHYRKRSRTRGRPKAEGGGGGSKVPARCSSTVQAGSRVPAKEADKVPAKEGRSSTVQADLTRGKREEEGSPNN